MTKLTEQQLGNYRLTRRLGKGGFAVVYLGEHVHLKTLAAIKVLHQVQLTSDEEKVPQRGLYYCQPQTSAYYRGPGLWSTGEHQYAFSCDGLCSQRDFTAAL